MRDCNTLIDVSCLKDLGRGGMVIVAIIQSNLLSFMGLLRPLADMFMTQEGTAFSHMIIQVCICVFFRNVYI